MISENIAKRKLKAGEPIMGCSTKFRDAALGEFLAHNGFDIVIMDGEHADLDAKFVEECAVAAKYAGACPIIKMRTDEALMSKYMDMGVMGFLVAMVRSADEIRRVISAMKYPPAGHRGVSQIRATRYSIKGSEWPAYQEKANKETFLVCALEDREGLAALPEIVTIPEIDVIFLGANDLGVDLGITGASLHHPRILEELAKFSAIVTGAGKAFGVGVSSTAEELRYNYRLGALFQLTNTTYMMRAVAEEFKNTLQSEHAGRELSVR